MAERIISLMLILHLLVMADILIPFASGPSIFLVFPDAVVTKIAYLQDFGERTLPLYVTLVQCDVMFRYEIDLPRKKCNIPCNTLCVNMLASSC